MQRTSNDDWLSVSRRLKQASRLESAGGVLMMYRRQKQERAMRVAGILMVVLLIAMTAAFAGVRRAGANRHSVLTPQLAQAGLQPTALPTIPPEYSHPLTFLLLGSDQRDDDRSYRTDVIVLVKVDPKNFTASAVSFPRDLWVEPPSLYPMKINMIQAIGGFDAMAEMFDTNFGVRPDYYVMVNFAGFTHLIDNLGGINVRIGEALTDRCDLPQEPSGVCSVEPGVMRMDGQTALWYARSRHSSSDYDRLRRAQEVVQGVFERMMSLDALAHLPETYAGLTNDLETNLSIGDITPLVPLAIRLFHEPGRIERHVIDENQATPSWSWDGMWILLPDPDAIGALLEQAGMR